MVEIKLIVGELIEVISVRTDEMREDRARNKRILIIQILYELWHIVNRVETQTMHTSIKFDMYRISCDTLFPCCMTKCIEKSEGIYLWLKFIVEHGLEGCHLRIHNHDVCCDASSSQLYALIGNGNSEIVNAMIL